MVIRSYILLEMSLKWFSDEILGLIWGNFPLFQVLSSVKIAHNGDPVFIYFCKFLKVCEFSMIRPITIKLTLVLTTSLLVLVKKVPHWTFYLRLPLATTGREYNRKCVCADSNKNYRNRCCHSRWQIEQITPDIYSNNYLVDILVHTK